MNTEKATPDLLAALAAAQGEIENATKNAKNPHFKNNYADLAECLNTIRPVFSAHGLSVIQSTAFDGALVNVTTVIGHKTGGMISSVASCVPAKSDAQGIGSATTYLRRYSVAAMCGIAQEDDDGQSARHETKPASVSAVFEKTHLPTMQAAAQDGLDALGEAFSKLPASPEKQAFWAKHGAALKETAGGVQ